jgi:hypothetical protein
MLSRPHKQFVERNENLPGIRMKKRFKKEEKINLNIRK